MTHFLNRRLALALTAGLLSLSASATSPMPPSAPLSPAMADDAFLWLEDVMGDKALAWVRERNAGTRALLEAHPDYAPNRARFKDILDSSERIPYATRQGEHFYNFWRSIVQFNKC